MDFTRQPIIETIITPKEGCKLVVRSSKSIGQEEFFVDALEVVSFGIALFFRSLERPKSFIVPASDYEILEIRETRMILKAASSERSSSSERSVRASNGREQAPKKEPSIEKPIAAQKEEAVPEVVGEASLEKRREKRRHGRRRRGREGALESEETAGGESSETEKVFPITIPTLLPPPPTLIAETIARYKDNSLFRGAFITPDETKAPVSKAETPSEKNPEDVLESMLMQNIDLEPTSYSTLEPVEEEKPFPLYSEKEFDESSEPSKE